MEGAGFEPAKAEPADLQSAPVDRLGTPPRCEPRIVGVTRSCVNRFTETDETKQTSPRCIIVARVGPSAKLCFADGIGAGASDARPEKAVGAGASDARPKKAALFPASIPANRLAGPA